MNNGNTGTTSAGASGAHVQLTQQELDIAAQLGHAAAMSWSREVESRERSRLMSEAIESYAYATSDKLGISRPSQWWIHEHRH